MRNLIKSISIMLLILVLVFCKNTDIAEPVEKRPAVLSLVSGGNQPGENGKKLAEPIVIKISDTENSPVENARVTFSVIDGGGTSDNSMVLSDSEGLARTCWTLGGGQEHIMKISISDQTFMGENIYVYAQTELNMETKWRSNIEFPQLFGSDIEHDNRILETNNFLIFSDGSSDDAKIRLAKFGEEAFSEVLKAFNVQSSEDFGILSSNPFTKIKIFSNINTYFPYGAFAFKTGYVIDAFDSQNYLRLSEQGKEMYRLDLKHETVHVIQFLTGLDNLPNLWPDVWFTEGIAVLISGNRTLVSSIQGLNEWRQIQGNYNPIRAKDFNNYPTQGRYWYNMFGTAVKYLLDEKGHGKTYTDVLEMYRYMASSHKGFADAFEKYMGMDLQYYEDNFWDIITEFLE